MEEDMLFSDIKLKEEAEEEIEEALNEMMNQEIHLGDEIIKGEVLKGAMLFDDINGDDNGDDDGGIPEIVDVEMREDDHLPDGESHFQTILQKYTHMRKTGSKNRWQRLKSSLARKEKALSTSKNLSAKFKARKKKIKEEEKAPEEANYGDEPPDPETELKQIKEEPMDELADDDGSVDANANQNISGLFSDEMLYCDECCRLWEGDCPDHGPLSIIEDASFPDDVDDKNRAEKTTPPQVSVSNTEAESGVWALEGISARTRFGPYEGKIVPAEVCTAYSWLIRKDGRPDHCVDATEPSLSNWMRFVNCARHKGQQNLHAYQYRGKIYYRTIRAVDPGEELLVWFDEEYARQRDADSEFSDGKNYLDVCPECPYPCASPLYLLEHKKLYHGELGTSRRATKKGFERGSSARERRSYNRSARSSANMRESSVNISTGSPTSDINIDDLEPTVNPETGEKSYACPACQKFILRRSHLKRHLLIHSAVKPYICKFCDKGFTRKDNFDSHVKLRHAHEFVPAISPRRSESPASEASLGESPPRESPPRESPPRESTPPPVIQPQPETRSSPRGHLRRQQALSASEKQFVCNQCNERFSRAEQVQAHMAVHVREKPFVCAQCNKRFINNAGLMMHQKIHKNMNEANGPSRKDMILNQSNGPSLAPKPKANRMCRVCGLQCRSLEHLTSHEHTHEDRFSKCFVCGKRFSHLNHLKRHLLIHAGYRPHECPHCEQTFSRTEHLKRHIRTHTRQGAFECAKCKKRFAKKLEFERHVKLHNADAPCLQDQRISVHSSLQKQLEKYINDEEDDFDEEAEEEEEEEEEAACDVIKQEPEDYVKQEPEDYVEDDEEEPLLNVFPEVILGAEN